VEESGLPADWLLDLVSIGFQSTLHRTGFQNLDQLDNASEMFVQQLTLPKGGDLDAAAAVPAGAPGIMACPVVPRWLSQMCHLK
jgi:hypothetical protein